MLFSIIHYLDMSVKKKEIKLTNQLISISKPKKVSTFKIAIYKNLVSWACYVNLLIKFNYNINKAINNIKHTFVF